MLSVIKYNVRISEGSGQDMQPKVDGAFCVTIANKKLKTEI